ncbi:hypothetical protein AUC68_05670 [Methyloceanibacter methanicus]|uniref:Phage head morphogenesis domain-containing protein n=1 Tax=Methyloceanibacter methanicus TaxID=1774968 RepID=A0A1E3W0W9_9HYPH|nr:phage minor head protein [Methyloceanibacter methanicus]ODR99454.1 hypothetical protein AUC68_05670 [Methyloceanibacter methanicus]
MVSHVPGGRAVHPSRVDRASPEYRKAFEAYLRHGTPIDLRGRVALEGKAESAARDHPTTHYIWRTRGDGRVRPSRAANDGKIFAWDDPPPTGHPGEDYGCRCWAEAYVPDAHEFFGITMQNVSDEGPPWDERWGFVTHYLLGGGQTVTVRETGNLKTVVAEYVRLAIQDPTQLSGKIADVARQNIGRQFDGKLPSSLDLRDAVFSIGRTAITARFTGRSHRDHAMLDVSGTIRFALKDAFRDPLDIEEGAQP